MQTLADDLELEFETPGRGLSGGKGRGTPPDQGVQDPDSAITVQVAPDRGAGLRREKGQEEKSHLRVSRLAAFWEVLRPDD